MKTIAIDFETHLISAEQPVPRPVCLSYYTGEGKKGLVSGFDGMEALLQGIMSSDYTVIAHNLQFELLVIDKYFPKLQSNIKNKLNAGQLVCTKINEQLIDNTRKKTSFSFALDSLVSSYFNTDISDEKHDPNGWRLRYSELEDVQLKDWPQEAIDYAINDSIWAHKLYMAQEKVDYKISVAADFYLNKMGQYGLLTDLDRVSTLERELLAIIVPKYESLLAVGLVNQDPKTGKYKKNMNLFRQYLIDNFSQSIVRTAKGVVSTTGEALDIYLSTNPEDTVLKDYLEVIKYEKILTAFVSRLKQANPVIRTSYKAVVSSGRTSSSTSDKYPSVNIQQMPRAVENVTWDIRNCFIPRPGYKICSIDYSGLELSATAHQLYVLTGRSEMKSIINLGDSPVDMHSMLAYRILNIKERTNETYEGFIAKKKEPKYKEYRQLAKPINLGFPGGIGYDTMRSLLAREGIYPKLKVLETSPYEDQLTWKRAYIRKEGYPVRIRRTGFREYQLIYDELVLLKQELFNLYPDLEYFLTEGHLNFLTGESKAVKNEFGEWEKEPMYSFEVQGFKRDWCMYTQVCNGLLMQSPAAIGAKKAAIKLAQRYDNSLNINLLAFIHDEFVFEVKDDQDMKANIQDVAEIMIDEMQSVLTSVRIAVEAEAMDYWAKSGGFFQQTYWKDSPGSDLKLK